MSSSPDSAARPLPRLARVWDGQIEPLNVARLKAETRRHLSCRARAGRSRTGAAARRGGRARDRSLRRVPDPGRRRAHALVSRDEEPAGRRGLRPHGIFQGRRPHGQARGESGLLSDRRPALADAAQPRRSARHRGRRDRRCEVRHFRRRPRAERSHAFFRKPRIGVGVRRVQPSARRRDGAGTGRGGHVRAASRAARSRHSRDDLRARRAWDDGGADCRCLRRGLSRRAVRPVDGRRAAGDQARGVDEFLRHRLALRRRHAAPRGRLVPGQSREGRGRPGAAEFQRRVRAWTNGRACCERTAGAQARRRTARGPGRSRRAWLRSPPRSRRIVRWSSCTAAGARSMPNWIAGRSRPGRSTDCASPIARRSTSSCRCWPARRTRNWSRRSWRSASRRSG